MANKRPHRRSLQICRVRRHPMCPMRQLRRHCAATCRRRWRRGARKGASNAPLRRTLIGGAIEIGQKPLKKRCFVAAQLAQWPRGPCDRHQAQQICRADPGAGREKHPRRPIAESGAHLVRGFCPPAALIK